MTRLIRTARDLKTTAPGIVAVLIAIGTVIALIALVIRGVAKDDLAEWGIVLGLFLNLISNLLTQAHGAGRATDTSTTETEIRP